MLWTRNEKGIYLKNEIQYYVMDTHYKYFLLKVNLEN